MRNVSHFYGSGALRKQVLFDVTCDIWPGEIVIMTGPSGSGKTTVLTLAGALRSVEHGSMLVLGHVLNGAGHNALVRIRESIGFVFQAHNLLESLTAAQNVQMSLGLSTVSTREARERSLAVLEAVGLADRSTYLPNQLSIGQRQRVAVARALVRQPKIILADEPTASLDRQSGRDVVELLRQLARRQGCAVLLVTHDVRILDIADRIMRLEDGRLSSFGSVASPFAGHLLTVLAQVRDKEHLWVLMEQRDEKEFVDLLKTMGGEVEQLLNILDLGGRESIRLLLDNLIDIVLLKISNIIDANAAGLFDAHGKHLRNISHYPSWPDREIAVRVSATGEVVNAFGGDLGEGVQSVLCVPIRNRMEEINAVAQFVNKKTGSPFTVADERVFRDFAAPLGFILEGWQRVKQDSKRHS
jgi:putative ABC transport system ATP-binding protein